MLKACMKMRCVSIIVLSILLSCLPDVTGLSAAAGAREHGRPYSFRRLPGTDGIFSAYAMVQDSSRFLWVGTDMGLVRYDGYRCETYRYSAGDSSSLCQDHVNALLYCPEYGNLVVGTDAGVSVYDFSRDEFFPLKACGYRHIKSILKDGRTMWVGTTEGLLRFDLSEGGLLPYMPAEEVTGLPSEHIACIRKIGDSVWFGAYDHMYRQLPSGEIETFRLPTSGKLVLDIIDDPEDPSSLWAGTEQGLFRYRTDGRSAEMFLESIPIKYFFRYDNENLWIGTDNGLFIMEEERTSVGEGRKFTRFSHKADNARSLPNNVVWCIYRDAGGNILLGTDHALAIAGISKSLAFVGIGELTGTNAGLDISLMAYDPHGNLWLGGLNGLVKTDASGKFVCRYNSDTGPAAMRLSHNKVRDIFDDGDGMWVVSDGGLDRISYKDGSVRHFLLQTADGKRFSDWMYSVERDLQGRLWIGSYDGLILVPDTGNLAASGGVLTAELLLNAETVPSISGNQVMSLTISGNELVSLSAGTVDCISLEDLSVRHVPATEDMAVYCIEGGNGHLWAGTDRGVYRIGDDGEAVLLPGFSLPVSSIALAGNRLFAISGTVVYAYDMAAEEWSHCSLGKEPLLCACHDGNGNMLFGTVDGYFIVDGDSFPADRAGFPVSITGLMINNRKVKVGEEYGGKVILEKSIGLLDRIVLGSSFNSFSLEFSSFNFSASDTRFAYRLTGLDDVWQETSGNRAVFLNVPAGEYRFEVFAVAPDGTMGGSVPAELGIRIRPVWYATTAAFVIYALLFIGIIVWIIYFMRMKHQLQIEHIEREDAMNMVKMKTEFFANVSHEFKSPMSIILGLLGRMISSESDAIKSRELNAVQKNAEKMHLLLNQMLAYNENGGTDLFLPSAVSLQQLAKEVFDSFVPSFEEKNINCRFMADDIRYVFMLDRVKMESVFQNLLSNALKFTPSGGTVLMSVTVGGETPDLLYADVKVEDTGCGIREDELPLLFSQYYRAPSNQKENVNGSGIGLYYTRQIVEMHKGKISVTSAPGKGTCFTVRLSTMKADSFVIRSDSGEHYSLHNLSKVWQHERKPILLLVEDNPDIRDFITASLGKDYTFCIASEGGAGLEILSREKIDLVVTDISMPGMDGLSMCRIIRNTVKTAFLPIIVLTGKNDMQTQLQSFEYADAFISKPFDLNYLNSRIIQLLIKHEQYLENMRKQQMLEPKQVETVQSPDEKFLQEIVEIVNRHITDPDFSASVLCSESHYGSKQIYRKIKQLTGMGVVEFIRETRLQRAAMYLSQKKLSVTEIMYMSGFTTASYFSKCFKARFGVSPSEYVPE